jgi:hypothetical protein
MEFTNAQRALEGLLRLLQVPPAKMQVTERLIESEGSPGVCAVGEKRFNLFQAVRCRIKPALLNLDGSEVNFG